ncbi:MAG: energy transducer TonB [Pseudomonadota bacterium]
MRATFKTSTLEYLNSSHFALMCGLALVLHIMTAFGISMIPHIKIIDIPVHAMNIRLGDSDVEQAKQNKDEVVMPQPTSDNSEMLESAMTKLIRKPPEKAAKPSPPKPKPLPLEKPPVQTPPVTERTDTPRQFVRATTPDKIVPGVGSVLGNSADSKAAIKMSYEQKISLWIQKFKLYPESARAQGMQGSTVVRIRIDRRGNIRYSGLEGNTGYAELDRAALDMVRRANPVPAVPEGYPEGEMFEFLIPVNFAIK